MYTFNIENWRFSYKNFKNIACTVPCSMYSVLLQNNLIDDPFYRDNEIKSTELSSTGCEFSTVFNVDSELFNNKHIVLRFNGIDTLAQVSLNSQVLGKTDNMHRVWEFDVKDIIKSGDNELHVKFDSPVLYMEEKQKEHYVWGVNEALNGVAHLRKSLCMSGWDWGPKLPDMGFFKNIEICAYDVKIEDVLIRQQHFDNKVKLSFNIKTNIKTDISISVKTPADDKLKVDGFECIIENPELWWPNGLGEQPLYEISVIVSLNGNICDTYVKKIGLRTLTVNTEKDKWGNEFCFNVNGVKFFAMGADYIPEDSILSRLSCEKTAKLLDGCVKANYNCIRVWGGGFYPHDWFYDECDRLGLVVWQDFMFACINVYLTEEFKENVKAEFVDNIKRIRNHACIGLLCGNNEMETAVLNWGLPSDELVKPHYLELYEKILPEICEKYAPDIFYWPSSPSSGGNFTDTGNESRGDIHSWDVWHNNEPFESYRKHYFKFCSEFGFESFPNIKTINCFAIEKDKNAFSKVMENHQKCASGNGKILTYLSQHYLYPESFDRLIYISQLLQADAVRYGVEHLRRNRGRCMGAVYWQLNDCWPVASWASVDYFGRWKALQYASKRFFAPVLLSVCDNGADVIFNISNEQRCDFNGYIEYSIKDNDFNNYYSNKIKVSVDQMSAKDIITENFGDYITDYKYTRFLEYKIFDINGNLISSSTLLFVKPKHFEFKEPQIEVEIIKVEGKAVINVSSDVYTKYVELDFKNTDVLLSLNYFDISSKEPIIIEIYNDNEINIDKLKKELTIHSVNSNQKRL